MPANLSWNEIQQRAIEFQALWAGESSEHAEANSFWDGFFLVFGMDRRRFASFQARVRMLSGRTGFIDCFWPGVLLIEHKSRGKDLDAAFSQATGYFDGLADRDLPKYVLVSDFARFRFYDLVEKTTVEFPLSELPRQIKTFGFIAGYTTHKVREQDPVNVQAAELMGRLHDLLKETGYDGHPLEVLLVRLLFCHFADSTGIFAPQHFRDWLESRCAEDGSDLGPRLTELFQVLNTPEGRRFMGLDELVAAFPFVNGRLFEETLPIPAFDAAMRSLVLDCCAIDWSRVSPAILGALFQSINDREARRALGEHYTSEANILKALGPLFLDDLHAEFERVKGNRNALFQFHQKLRRINVLDPACGCGNFLVVAYRELRLLELAVLRADAELRRNVGQQVFDVHALIQVDVDQFHGIEIVEFPARIAEVAMWLIDHQMNRRVSDEFGMYFARIPLRKSANIVIGNAIRMDWCDVVLPERVSYIVGNPPFVGKQYRSPTQKEDVGLACAGMDGSGVLDYVASWFVKASRYLAEPSPIPQDAGRARGCHVKCAFVATNSITQGEQTGVLWAPLLSLGIRIQFAHRTFQWSNEAKGKAAVHCVIVGFGLNDCPRKVVYDYSDPRANPVSVQVANISPYLLDGPDVVLLKRGTPLGAAPPIVFGSMANDGGHLLLSNEQKTDLLLQEPAAEKWIRPFMGADEFLYGYRRWCLWLVSIEPGELRAMTLLKSRVDLVRKHRLESPREATRALAASPALFGEIRQPQGDYLVIPRVTSEDRAYIPIGYETSETIASDRVQIVPAATRFQFGILGSRMHMAWTKTTCGRLESRFNYSNQIVYNNFPWPGEVSDKIRTQVELAARNVLDVRAKFPKSSLADLYDPLSMPPELVEAHRGLDRAVDAAYLATLPEGFTKPKLGTDLERVAFLFRLYEHYTGTLGLAPAAKPRKGRGRTRTP